MKQINFKTSKNKWCPFKYVSLNFYHIFIAISIYEENTLHLKTFLLQCFTYIWIKRFRLNKPTTHYYINKMPKVCKAMNLLYTLAFWMEHSTVFLYVSGQKELPNFSISFINVPFISEPTHLFIIVNMFGIILCHFIVSPFNMQWTSYIVIQGFTSHCYVSDSRHDLEHPTSGASANGQYHLASFPS